MITGRIMGIPLGLFIQVPGHLALDGGLDGGPVHDAPDLTGLQGLQGHFPELLHEALRLP